MKALNELHVIDGGDHSFKIGKKHLQANGSTQDEAEVAAVKAIAAFISKSLEGWWCPHLKSILVYGGSYIHFVVSSLAVI